MKPRKRLASTFEVHDDPSMGFGPCAVVSVYRQALEYYLKALVIWGASFLDPKPDRHSVMKTRSLSWLAQFTCQILTEVNLLPYFRCDGMESMADFNALVNDINHPRLQSPASRWKIEGWQAYKTLEVW